MKLLKISVEFKKKSDLIITNRLDQETLDVKEKVFNTRYFITIKI